MFSMMNQLEKKPKGFLLFAGILLLIPVIFVSLWSIKLLQTDVSYQQKNLKVQNLLDDVSEEIKNIEILKERIYRTNTQTEIDLLEKDYQKLNSTFNALAQLVVKDPEQYKSLLELKEAILSIQDLSIEEAIESLRNIDNIIAEMDAREIKKVYEQERQIKDTIEHLVWMSVGAILLSIVLVVYTGISMRQEIAERKLMLGAMAESERKAVEGSLMKSRFLATVSHEIRTPLNGIIAFSNLLIREVQDPQTLKKLEVISSSGKTLLRIINDILDFSKIEAGKITLEMTDFQLSDLILQTISSLEIRATEKKLQLQSQIDPLLPSWVRGDSDRIAQVLFNLIGNAIKFTDNGSVLVKVTQNHADADGYSVRFTIHDTGIGISQEQIKSLFKPFEIHKKGTHGEQGTGLGLAITKEILEAMNSQVEVISDSTGTQFTFNLYLKKSARADASSSDGHLVTQTFPHLSILVVEDNPTNQVITQSLLERFQCKSQVASNGAEAVEILRSSAFDLVLMDCLMPVMDGFEATRKIRQELQRHELPIIAMTANAHVDDEKNCYLSGMNDFIAKPITLESLQSLIQYWCGPDRKRVANPAIRLLNNRVGSVAVKKIIETFLRTNADFYDTARQYLQTHNSNEAQRLAHKVKSSALSLGGYQLAEQLARIESEPQTALIPQEWDKAQQLMQKFYQELEVCRDSLS